MSGASTTMNDAPGGTELPGTRLHWDKFPKDQQSNNQIASYVWRLLRTVWFDVSSSHTKRSTASGSPGDIERTQEGIEKSLQQVKRSTEGTFGDTIHLITMQFKDERIEHAYRMRLRAWADTEVVGKGQLLFFCCVLVVISYLIGSLLGVIYMSVWDAVCLLLYASIQTARKGHIVRNSTRRVLLLLATAVLLLVWMGYAYNFQRQSVSEFRSIQTNIMDIAMPRRTDMNPFSRPTRTADGLLVLINLVQREAVVAGQCPYSLSGGVDDDRSGPSPSPIPPTPVPTVSSASTPDELACGEEAVLAAYVVYGYVIGWTHMIVVQGTMLVVLTIGIDHIGAKFSMSRIFDLHLTFAIWLCFAAATHPTSFLSAYAPESMLAVVFVTLSLRAQERRMREHFFVNWTMATQLQKQVEDISTSNVEHETSLKSTQRMLELLQPGNKRSPHASAFPPVIPIKEGSAEEAEGSESERRSRRSLSTFPGGGLVCSDPGEVSSLPEDSPSPRSADTATTLPLSMTLTAKQASAAHRKAAPSQPTHFAWASLKAFRVPVERSLVIDVWRLRPASVHLGRSDDPGAEERPAHEGISSGRIPAGTSAYILAVHGGRKALLKGARRRAQQHTEEGSDASERLGGRGCVHVGAVERLRREIHILMTLNHPNLLPFLGFHETKDTSYVLLQAPGLGTLQGLLSDRPEYARTHALSIARDVSSGLLYLHSLHRLGHRRVCPRHIAIQANNMACLFDLEFAAEFAAPFVDDAPTTAATDAWYAAPELQRGGFTGDFDVDCRCDVFSLGLVLLAVAIAPVPIVDFFSREWAQDPVKGALVTEHFALDDAGRQQGAHPNVHTAFVQWNWRPDLVRFHHQQRTAMLQGGGDDPGMVTASRALSRMQQHCLEITSKCWVTEVAERPTSHDVILLVEDAVESILKKQQENDDDASDQDADVGDEDEDGRGDTGHSGPVTVLDMDTR